MTSPTKNSKSRTFQLKKKLIRRLPASLGGLKSSLAQLAGELWWCKVMQEKWLSWVLKGNQPAPKVLRSLG